MQRYPDNSCYWLGGNGCLFWLSRSTPAVRVVRLFDSDVTFLELPDHDGYCIQTDCWKLDISNICIVLTTHYEVGFILPNRFLIVHKVSKSFKFQTLNLIVDFFEANIFATMNRLFGYFGLKKVPFQLKLKKSH